LFIRNIYPVSNYIFVEKLIELCSLTLTHIHFSGNKLLLVQKAKEMVPMEIKFISIHWISYLICYPQFNPRKHLVISFLKFSQKISYC
jgi:hypothetical protein